MIIIVFLPSYTLLAYIIMSYFCILVDNTIAIP